MIVEQLLVSLGFDIRNEQAVRTFNRQVEQARKGLSAFQSVLAGFAGGVGAGAFLALADGIGNALARIPKDALAAGSTMEKLRVRFETMEGSADKAARSLDFVRKTAAATPLSLTETADAFAKLRNFGLDPTDGSLRSLIDVMAGTGKSAAELDGIVTAVGQAFGKGKLQAEEMNQLIERGVPAWDALSKVTGKNVGSLQKMAEKGELGRDIIKKLIGELGRRNPGAAERMSRTWEGVTARISDAWFEMSNMIAEAGFFDAMKRGAEEVLEAFRRWNEDGTLKTVATSISNVLTGAMRFGREGAEAVLRFGQAGVDAAKMLGDLVDRVTGLQTGMAGGAAALAAGVLALTNAGRALLRLLGRLFPALAVLATIDDLLAYSRGENSLIGYLLKTTHGATEQLNKLKEATGGLKTAWNGFVENVRKNDGLKNALASIGIDIKGALDSGLSDWQTWAINQMLKGMEQGIIALRILVQALGGDFEGLKRNNPFAANPERDAEREANRLKLISEQEKENLAAAKEGREPKRLIAGPGSISGAPQMPDEELRRRAAAHGFRADRDRDLAEHAQRRLREGNIDVERERQRSLSDNTEGLGDVRRATDDLRKSLEQLRDRLNGSITGGEGQGEVKGGIGVDNLTKAAGGAARAIAGAVPSASALRGGGGLDAFGSGGVSGGAVGAAGTSGGTPGTPNVRHGRGGRTPGDVAQSMGMRARGGGARGAAGTSAPGQFARKGSGGAGKLTPEYSNDLKTAINQSASDLGVSAEDLATMISFETGGTFDKWKRGPTTKWGTHRGLIQWGEPQAKKYGVTKDSTVGEQMKAVTRYLRDHGVKPGMNGANVYAAINAGNANKLGARDAAAGGTWGTVADKWNHQMDSHRQKARTLLAGSGGESRSVSSAPATPTQANRVATVPKAPAFTTAPAFTSPLAMSPSAVLGQVVGDRNTSIRGGSSSSKVNQATNITINNPRGEVVPQLVAKAVDKQYETASRRATDVALQPPAMEDPSPRMLGGATPFGAGGGAAP